MKLGKQKKTSVLVVDDEQIVQESVKRILEDEEDCVVDAASGYDAAIIQLRAKPYDLVFTDLMMPAHNGMKLVETIHKTYPRTGIVILTGYPSVDSAVESMKMGALDYMAKPFTPEDLVKVTRRSLQTVTEQDAQQTSDTMFDEVEKAIKSSLDIKHLLDLICASAVSLLDVKGASVFVKMKDYNKAWIASYFGLSEAYANKGILDCSRSISETFNSNKCVLVAEESFESSLNYPAEARDEGISSILSVPLSFNNSVIGALRLYALKGTDIGEKHVDLARKLATQASIAIENATKYERVRSDIIGMKTYL